MIEFYAGLLGEYPFVEDQYGMSAFPLGGAMEHTANTSYGYGLITGDDYYDWIVAHELAHQWFGDSVSPETWDDVWLNEGFATYAEALWFEHLGGKASYQAYMQTLKSSSFQGPVYAPDSLFSATTYDKGGWVLHMLRGVLGPAAFFDALRDWYEANRDGVGSTAELQAVFEVRYGGSLDWFFQSWVYGAGRPVYEHGFSTVDLGDGTFRTYVRVDQVQTGTGLFTMPIPLELVTPSGAETRTVWNDSSLQVFVLDTAESVAAVNLDPEEWILREAYAVPIPDADADGVPDEADNCMDLANPLQPDLDADGSGDACDPDDDGDLLPDELDCAPFDPSQGRPGEVPLLTVAAPGGVPTLSWVPAAGAESHDVSRTLLSELAGGYGACWAPGLGGLSVGDPEAVAAGDGHAYLVAGRDAGCGGSGPAGVDSGGLPRPEPCP
jgi:hypothetical protein